MCRSSVVWLKELHIRTRKNGYSVLKCRVKDYRELVSVIGNMIDANVGSVLVCEGNWKVDSKYGRQFVADYPNHDVNVKLCAFTDAEMMSATKQFEGQV